MSFLPKPTFKNPYSYGVTVVSFVIGFGTSEFLKNNGSFTTYHPQGRVDYQTCFTPAQRCLPLILKEIDKAQKTIKAQAYSFTSKEITQTLIRAPHLKGVKVIVIADKS